MMIKTSKKFKHHIESNIGEVVTKALQTKNRGS